MNAEARGYESAFNRGVELLDLHIRRVWVRSRVTALLGRGQELNPYRTGDLPTSQAFALKGCLEGLLSSGDLLSLPLEDQLGATDFVMLGGQYGCLHFGKTLSFFVDGIYGEIEPRAGEYYPPPIAIPSVLLSEFQAFALRVGLRERYRSGDSRKNPVFHSELFSSIQIGSDFNRVDAQLIVKPTLWEYELRDDASITGLSSWESERIRIGDVAVPEAITIGEVSSRLRRLDKGEREIERQEIVAVLSGGGQNKAKLSCHGLVLIHDSDLAFVLPPEALTRFASPNLETTPVVAVPTERLLALL